MLISSGKNPWREKETKARLECCTASASKDGVEVVLRLEDQSKQMLIQMSMAEAASLHKALVFLLATSPPANDACVDIEIDEPGTARVVVNVKP